MRYLHRKGVDGALRFRREVPEDVYNILPHTSWNLHFPAGTASSIVRRTVKMMTERSNREIEDARKNQSA